MAGSDLSRWSVRFSPIVSVPENGASIFLRHVSYNNERLRSRADLSLSPYSFLLSARPHRVIASHHALGSASQEFDRV
jgi:hypothetical protein